MILGITLLPNTKSEAFGPAHAMSFMKWQQVGIRTATALDLIYLPVFNQIVIVASRGCFFSLGSFVQKRGHSISPSPFTKNEPSADCPAGYYITSPFDG